MVILNSVVIWLHLVAAVTWLGAAIGNMLVMMPSLAAIDSPPARGKFMSAAIKRMSGVSWTAIVILVVTGIYQLVTKLSSANILVSTPYGVTLLIKLVLAAAMIALAAYLGLVLGPKMAAPPARAPMAGGAGGPPPQVAKLQRQLIAIATTNIVLGLLVLGAVAVMRSV